MEQLKPWQRRPAWWVCAECGAPSEGWWSRTGMVIHACDNHREAIAQLLETQWGLSAFTGMAVIRMPWRYWAAIPYWRTRYRLANGQRDSREQRKLLDSICEGRTLLEREERR